MTIKRWREDALGLINDPSFKMCRFWDLAATEQRKAGHDPDWTAGALLGLEHSGVTWILDVRRARKTPLGVEEFLWDTHLEDDERCGRLVPVRFEIEPGSSGALTEDQFRRNKFLGVDFGGERPKASKYERAKPLSRAAEKGLVHIIEGRWNDDFLDEIEAFTGEDGEHDDMVDAAVGAFHWLVEHRFDGVAPEALGQTNTWGAV